MILSGGIISCLAETPNYLVALYKKGDYCSNYDVFLHILLIIFKIFFSKTSGVKYFS